MTLTELLLSMKNKKNEWHQELLKLPLVDDERIFVDDMFTRRNPTFGQAFVIKEIERKYR